MDVHLAFKPEQAKEPDTAVEISETSSEPDDLEDLGGLENLLVRAQSIEDQVEPKLYDSNLNERAPVKELLSISFEVVTTIAQLVEQIEMKIKRSSELQTEIDYSLDILSLFQCHYRLLTDIICHPEVEFQVTLEKKCYKRIKDLYLEKVWEPRISPIVIERSLNYILNTLFAQLQRILVGITKAKKKSQLVNSTIDFRIINSKLSTVLEYLPTVITYDRIDIMTLSPEDQRFQNILRFVTKRIVASKERLEKEFRMQYRVINTASAVMTKGNGVKGGELMKSISYLRGAVFYFLNSSQATRTANLTISKGEGASVMQLWSLPDTSMIKNAMKLVYQSIETNKKIYLDRLFPTISLERLDKEAKGEMSPLLDINECATVLKEYKSRKTILKDLFVQKPGKIQVRLLYYKKLKFIERNESNFKDGESTDTSKEAKGDKEIDFIQKNNERRAKINEPEMEEIKTNKEIIKLEDLPKDDVPDTVAEAKAKEEEQKQQRSHIHHEHVHEPSNGHAQGLHSMEPLSATVVPKRAKKEKEGMLQSIVNLMSPIKKPHRPHIHHEIQEIIIHIHGGGFVSMSSSSHQNYTRRWANSVLRPVFSIDYRLAPENPFPAALDDCWQVYNWILAFSEEILGIAPKKVYLAGDSAGGNLIMALTIRAIQSGVKVPDGILAIYPALNLYSKKFTPSYLYSIDDFILSYSSLKVCLSSYIPKGADPSKSYYLSPGSMPDEIVKKLPPIRIMVGEKDPLHDDCWRFLEKLVKANKNVKMFVYEGLPHAFMSYDNLKGHKIWNNDSVLFLIELMQLGRDVKYNQ